MRQARSAERKPTLSPTKIATYLECAIKYRYIYVDKIGRYYLRSRAGFSFGSTLHHVLQSFHSGGEQQSSSEMAAELDRRWISASYVSAQQEAEHHADGIAIVTAYRMAHENRAERGVATISTEQTISADLGRFKLSGRVDRIDQHADGTIEVIDYKSGRLDVSEADVRASLAMCCYLLILARLYPGVAILGTIYCLRSGKSASTSLTIDELLEFERDTITLGNKILDTEFETRVPVPVPACEDCDFLSRCEQYWRSNPADEDWPGDASHSDFGD